MAFFFFCFQFYIDILFSCVFKVLDEIKTSKVYEQFGPYFQQVCPLKLVISIHENLTVSKAV